MQMRFLAPNLLWLEYFRSCTHKMEPVQKAHKKKTKRDQRTDTKYIMHSFRALLLLAACLSNRANSFQTSVHQRTTARPMASNFGSRAASIDYYPFPEEDLPLSTLEDADVVPAHITKKKKPSIQAWTRRLNTKQDKFSMHKLSSGAFVLSSTVLLGGMAFGSNQLHEIPTWLAPFDTAFTLSTTVQGLMGVNMVLEHRKRDPEVGKTQIEMGFNSILMALYSSWESPFCSSFLEEHWKLMFGSLIVGLAVMDFNAAFGDSEKIQERMVQIGVKTPETIPEMVNHFFCFYAQFVAGSTANLAFLARFMLDTTIDRDGFLQLIQSGYGLPFASGAEMPLIYFTTVLSSVIISYQSLLATLANKKLIPANTATGLISASTIVILCALGQLPFANSMYM